MNWEDFSERNHIPSAMKYDHNIMSAFIHLFIVGDPAADVNVVLSTREHALR